MMAALLITKIFILLVMFTNRFGNNESSYPKIFTYKAKRTRELNVSESEEKISK